jgi:myo-inositol 2-dehydrogenase / D-chiro-inositol 1-dehydrogenase
LDDERSGCRGVDGTLDGRGPLAEGMKVNHPLRLLVVGHGVRGRQWVGAIASTPGIDLAGVVDVAPPALRDLAYPTFTRLGDALEVVTPDGAILATPPETHFTDTLLLFAQQIPVLCEKPLAESVDEAAALVRESQRQKVPLLVGMNYRFLPVIERLRAIVHSGELGKLLYGAFSDIRNRDGTRTDLNSYPLTMNQPMLLEESVHHIDLIRFAYGREVDSVVSDTWNPSTSVYASDSCVAALMRFADGTRLSYLGAWTSGTNRYHFNWRTDFENGVVVQKDFVGSLFAARRVPGQERVGPHYNTAVEPLESLNVPEARMNVEDTEQLLEHFARTLRDEEAPRVSGADHLRTLAVLHAIELAAQTGRRVPVAEIYARLGVGVY